VQKLYSVSETVTQNVYTNGDAGSRFDGRHDAIITVVLLDHPRLLFRLRKDAREIVVVIRIIFAGETNQRFGRNFSNRNGAASWQTRLVRFLRTLFFARPSRWDRAGRRLSFRACAAVDGTAWKSKPSWYIVGKNDRTVHPELERFVAKRMKATTHELESSHVPMLSKPNLVLDVIRAAANA
jgi:pimeloyl-ACP methyl ester carboxylesterase